MLLDLIILIMLAKSTSYEAPHYAVFPSLPSLHLSLVQMPKLSRRLLLKWVLEEEDGLIWTGFVWLSVGTSWGLLWTG
jgi:hypothetical protein